MTLIECVPNFSTANPRIIDHIRTAIAQTGAHVLDVSSDSDHNRTVITFAGAPQVVVEGAFRAIEAAAQHIDLTEHVGVHPRIGASDVVPLVPLRDARLSDCAEWAQALGERVGKELGLPVFLYEAAAKDPHRTNLADIRRGGYEKLQERIHNDPTMQPDYGSTELGKAGAVVIGARNPLIAYNAYLNTDDVTIAKQIAKSIRAANGGVPNLKALGLMVNGRAQVSMNVIDFRQTSLYTITEAVRQAAAEHGVTVIETELVGLVPQAALINAAIAYLGLPSTVRDWTIEKRLGDATNDYREIPFE